MTLADVEKDLEMVTKAIEQSLANHNVLIGQKQALEHVANKMKTVADTVATVADAVDATVEPAQPTQENPA